MDPPDAPQDCMKHLPNELLLVVFKIFIDQFRCSRYRANWEPEARPETLAMQAPYTLLQVCKYWHDVLVSTPTFWTHIFFTTASQSQQDRLNEEPVIRGTGDSDPDGRHMLHFLERSKNQPLHVTIWIPRLHWTSEAVEASVLSFQALLATSSRWESALIFCNMWTPDRHSRLIDARQTRWCILKALLLDDYHGLLSPLLFAHAPMLRCVTLKHERAAVFQFPWSQITQIETTDEEVLLKVLSASPNIIFLSAQHRYQDKLPLLPHGNMPTLMLPLSSSRRLIAALKTGPTFERFAQTDRETDDFYDGEISPDDLLRLVIHPLTSADTFVALELAFSCVPSIPSVAVLSMVASGLTQVRTLTLTFMLTYNEKTLIQRVLRAFLGANGPSGIHSLHLAVVQNQGLFIQDPALLVTFFTPLEELLDRRSVTSGDPSLKTINLIHEPELERDLNLSIMSYYDHNEGADSPYELDMDELARLQGKYEGIEWKFNGLPFVNPFEEDWEWEEEEEWEEGDGDGEEEEEEDKEEQQKA